MLTKEKTILGITENSFTIENVLSSFQKFQAKKTSDRKAVTWAKNSLLLYLITEEIKKNNKIEISIPWSFSCSSCNGLGFTMELSKVELAVPCVSCNGIGWFSTICRKCNNGTDKNGKQCHVCNGTGRYIYKKTIHYEGIPCKCCEGKGTTKKQIVNIKPPVECKVCRGTGKVKTANNPVLSEQVIKKLFPSRTVVISP